MSEVPDKSNLLRQKESVPEIPEHPDVEDIRTGIEVAQRTSHERTERSLAHVIPKNLLVLEGEHGFSASFNGAIKAYERFGLFSRKGERNSLMSPREIRDGAPSIGDVMDELKRRPELLEKIKQGFVKVLPVPFGLSPALLTSAMGKAIAEYYDENAPPCYFSSDDNDYSYYNGEKLRSSDGKSLRQSCKPIYMMDVYEGADNSGELIYFPERFEPEYHGGKTKKEILETSQFPGWQVLLIENQQNIPQQEEVDFVGGRLQIGTNITAHEYLDELLHRKGYELEQGITPEAWQALFLAHIAESNGEVLDDYQATETFDVSDVSYRRAVGSTCSCIGAYFPHSGMVPRAYWCRYSYQARVTWGDPSSRFSDEGTRAVVKVL